MKFVISGAFQPPTHLIPLAKAADEAGYAAIAFSDHAVYPETLDTPYVEMALLKGASRTRLVLRHALPNALGPIVNAVALSLSYLLGGVIIVETIFNYPGIAKLMVDAVSTRDLPLIQGLVLTFGLLFIGVNLSVDLLVAAFNPRLRHG